MWCLLFLLCSQGIAFAAGITASSTLSVDTSSCKKTHNPECFMNVGVKHQTTTIQASLKKTLLHSATLSEIIRYHGYPREEYEVTTEDGYILAVFRIPAGRNSQNAGKKPALLLHHGVLSDSINWTSNLPINSLGFILADTGYDVWMGNSRGDAWSLKHKTLKPCQKEFWQFSFDEIGKYNIPAELYFIVNKTGQKDVYYVGHSEDATAGFVAFSTYPELSQKIRAFFALGPVATITHATSPTVAFTGLPQSLIRLLLGCNGVLHHNELMKGPLTCFCGSLGKVCGSILCLIAGGRIQNLNRTAPPVYKIEEITIPIAVWSGGEHTFADPKDMARLLPWITNLINHEHFPAWGHLDFIWCLDATEKMYIKVIELLKKHP